MVCGLVCHSDTLTLSSLKSALILGDSNTEKLQFGVGKGTFGGGVPGMRAKLSKLLDIPHPDELRATQVLFFMLGLMTLEMIESML